ncbi:hypothetical protein [Haloarcula marina]|uniref:hypothetical protein n=1 Tax=Haloarcula marina TaxID=2961574 RepID=UPI0020B7807B|nr:hypothetical protein [Halomicroarcula marina]
MRRRQVLSAAAFALPTLAGCSDVTGPGDRSTTGDTATDTDTPTSTATDTPMVTPNPDDPVLFVLSNETESEKTVSLRLSHAETVLLDETATLDSGASREYDPGISETGRYELVVEVEGGPRRTLSLDMDGYTVRTGANHYVSVISDRIDIYWEE